MSPRVLLAGLFHETHTFLEGTTPLSAWQVRRGAELLAAEGDGSPLGGAVRVGREHGWEFVSVIDLRATPSATVEDEVVETFWTEVSRAARDALSRGLDGVYLVLHGAMVSESHADVEGEILERLRGIPGMENVPICGVLDLHANATARMAKFGDALIAYRENPHIDAEAAAMDAARLLDRLMASTELASSPPLPTAGQGAVSAPPLPKGGP
ncbi:MAG: M81 family metallopeptidase, partial [Planctomycetia bacterium]|nr:M81 family metallopeptidase [Planctomycetia bacterium]